MNGPHSLNRLAADAWRIDLIFLKRNGRLEPTLRNTYGGGELETSTGFQNGIIFNKREQKMGDGLLEPSVDVFF